MIVLFAGILNAELVGAKVTSTPFNQSRGF